MLDVSKSTSQIQRLYTYRLISAIDLQTMLSPLSALSMNKTVSHISHLTSDIFIIG
jgi:hypothetical protein